jgi:Fe-S cluster assembly ATP-binding protein
MKTTGKKKKVSAKRAGSFFVKDLHVSVQGASVVRGVNIAVQPGEVHIIMGPNGSGKSTLLNAIFGNPQHTVLKGTIRIGRKDLTSAPVFERARAGLFLGFQEPSEIPGLHIGSFLRTAKNTLNDARGDGAHLTPMAFSTILKDALQTLGMDERFGGRALNDGFSGGEKKKSELLQMVILQPAFAFLDEFDSGMDVDALKTACAVINAAAQEQKTGFILVSHNPRILDSIHPERVHIMVGGRIVRSGGKEISKQVEMHGYEYFGK